jgi:hypothetical protein
MFARKSHYFSPNMREYIKAILVFIYIVSGIDCLAQTIYDPNTAKKYDSVYKKLPAHIQETLPQSGEDTSYNHGLAILTEDKTDTLNKNDFGQGNSSYYAKVSNQKSEILLKSTSYGDWVAKQ